MPVEAARRERLPTLEELPDDTLLTTAQVAAALGLSDQTLRTWASRRPEGKLLPSRKIGYRNRYRADDIRRWLEQGRPAPEPNGV